MAKEKRDSQNSRITCDARENNLLEPKTKTKKKNFASDGKHSTYNSPSIECPSGRRRRIHHVRTVHLTASEIHTHIHERYTIIPLPRTHRIRVHTSAQRTKDVNKPPRTDKHVQRKHDDST